MATDEEKSKIAKLLQGLGIPDTKISERGSCLVREFEQKYGSEFEGESEECEVSHENPYIPNKDLLEKNETKLQKLLAEGKRAMKKTEGVILSVTDPKRPWRTNSSKERLLRIDGELKRHIEKASEAIAPMNEGDMKGLVEECRQETTVAPPVGADRLRDTVDQARRNLPRFQYRNIQNSTAIAICSEAHREDSKCQNDLKNDLTIM